MEALVSFCSRRSEHSDFLECISASPSLIVEDNNVTVWLDHLYGAQESAVVVCIEAFYISLIQGLVVLLAYGLPLAVLDESVVVLKMCEKVIKTLHDWYCSLCEQT